MLTTVRELKLRPEFAHLYPGLTANVWIRGTVLAQWLSARAFGGAAGESGISALVSDRHFAFRETTVAVAVQAARSAAAS